MNTSPPRNRFTFLRSSCSDIENFFQPGPVQKKAAETGEAPAKKTFSSESKRVEAEALARKKAGGEGGATNVKKTGEGKRKKAEDDDEDVVIIEESSQSDNNAARRPNRAQKGDQTGRPDGDQTMGRPSGDQTDNQGSVALFDEGVVVGSAQAPRRRAPVSPLGVGPSNVVADGREGGAQEGKRAREGGTVASAAGEAAERRVEKNLRGLQESLSKAPAKEFGKGEVVDPESYTLNLEPEAFTLNP